MLTNAYAAGGTLREEIVGEGKSMRHYRPGIPLVYSERPKAVQGT